MHFRFAVLEGRVSLSVYQDETVLARGAAAMATRSAGSWFFGSCVFGLHGYGVSWEDKARNRRRNVAGDVEWMTFLFVVDILPPSAGLENGWCPG